jgi:hypothetical protein
MHSTGASVCFQQGLSKHCLHAGAAAGHHAAQAVLTRNERHARTLAHTAAAARGAKNKPLNPKKYVRAHRRRPTSAAQSSLQAWHTPLSSRNSARRSPPPLLRSTQRPSHSGPQNSAAAPCSTSCARQARATAVRGTHTGRIPPRHSLQTRLRVSWLLVCLSQLKVHAGALANPRR